MAYFQVDKLVKYFGGLAAVNGVSFEVDQGQIFGLIGPNGSGKTTTFNMISGYHRPTSGRVLFQGREIHRLPTHKICHLGIGRTFQVVKPLGRMTVLDNVIAAAFSRVNTHHKAREEALKAIDFCGLMPVKDVLAKALPIAGRKRLEITRAMATRPKLLLLDETAAGLNPSELVEAIELIRKIRDERHHHRHHRAHHARDHDHLRPDPRDQLRPDDRRRHAEGGGGEPAVIEAYLGTDYA